MLCPPQPHSLPACVRATENSKGKSSPNPQCKGRHSHERGSGVVPTVRFRFALLNIPGLRHWGRGAHTKICLHVHEGTARHLGKTVSLAYFSKEPFCSQVENCQNPHMTTFGKVSKNPKLGYFHRDIHP